MKNAQVLGDYIWLQIKAEDNANSVSKRFNVSPSNIIRNNPNIDYYEGEMVKIWLHNVTKHIVKPMENLSSIANKYQVQEQDIITQNNLNTSRLFIGQILTINKDKT